MDASAVGFSLAAALTAALAAHRLTVDRQRRESLDKRRYDAQREISKAIHAHLELLAELIPLLHTIHRFPAEQLDWHKVSIALRTLLVDERAHTWLRVLREHRPLFRGLDACLEELAHRDEQMQQTCFQISSEILTPDRRPSGRQLAGGHWQVASIHEQMHLLLALDVGLQNVTHRTGRRYRLTPEPLPFANHPPITVTRTGVLTLHLPNQDPEPAPRSGKLTRWLRHPLKQIQAAQQERFIRAMLREARARKQEQLPPASCATASTSSSHVRR